MAPTLFPARPPRLHVGAPRAGRHRTRWIALATVLLAGGLIGSVVAARTVSGTDSKRAHAAFISSAEVTAAALTSALQHEEDLVVSARVYLSGDREGSNSSEEGFLQWTSAVEALARYPEVEGGGEVLVVPRARLASFAAKIVAEPANGTVPGGKFQVLPPGPRPFYCLVSVSFARHLEPATSEPAGLDYCSIPSLHQALTQARDTGSNAYLAFRSGSKPVLIVYTPLYYGHGVPATLAARRARFRGGFGTTIVPGVVLATARQGRENIAIVLHRKNSSQGAFRSGTFTAHGQRTTRRLPNGWVMDASAPSIATGVMADGKALLLLIGGVALSLLISLLVYVLGTGRARALLMVHEKTAEISHQALHDALTGLPNRVLVLDRAERMLARARREPNIVTAALYVDIDRFKYVNDSFGHAAGDTLLAVVGERLESVIRDQDTVGRMGGDEFVVLLESSARDASPQAIAERVIGVLREPVILEDGRSIPASVSIGIAIGSRRSAEQLLQDADLALYSAKAAGKDRAVLFQASMQNDAAARLQLELDLSEALDGEELFLLYQPILELNSRRVVGVEALLRWQHPKRGIVEPNDFIELAEETGRIAPIGRWVLSEACRQAAVWEAQGRGIGISVNVSVRQLDREDFTDDVRLALEESGLEPASLTLEITETALMHDVQAAAERLKEVAALGVRVAIDDFGTGSSSLSYLRQFDVDSIKIDQSFVAGMSESSESAAIVHTLVELGRLMGIESVAEGIETSDQLARLKSEGCANGQGFLFAGPLDAAGLEAFLSGGPTRRRQAVG